MTWLGWSLLLASTVYVVFRRRTIAEYFVAFWRPSHITIRAPAPSLSVTDTDSSVDGASDQASSSAISTTNQDAPVKRTKAAVEAVTDRQPAPILPPPSLVDVVIDAPTEIDTPVVAIESPPSPQTTPKANEPIVSPIEDTVPSLTLSLPTSTVDPPPSVSVEARTEQVVTPTIAAPVESSPTSATRSPRSPGMSMPPPPSRLPRLSKMSNNKSSSSGSSSSLAPPATRPSPLPNRAQHQFDRQPGTSTLAPPPTHSSKPAKPSRKVTLEPGHSPLDWARLANHPTSDLRGLGPGAPYLRVTPSMLKQQTGRRGKDAWTVLSGRVYNMTPYLPFHPGGEPELLRAAGRDGTKLFGEIHPWVNYETMLSSCLIGIFVNEIEAQSTGDMEAMD